MVGQCTTFHRNNIGDYDAFNKHLLAALTEKCIQTIVNYFCEICKQVLMRFLSFFFVLPTREPYQSSKGTI